MDSNGGAPATILLVEDNQGDVRLVEEAFAEVALQNTLHSVTDGESALDFIHREGEYPDAPRPDLVLLDLYLPKVDGEEVLHEIKTHPELSGVPVVILTGVDDDYVESRDLDHEADEDAVIQKPLDPDELLEVVRELDGFGLSIVRTDG